MRTYFDREMDWPTYAALGTGLSREAGAFNPAAVRDKLQETEAFDSGSLRRYALYPLDDRWCYYTVATSLWNRARPELLAQRPVEESFFIVRRFAERPKEGRPATVTSALPDYHLLRPNGKRTPCTALTIESQDGVTDLDDC